MSRSPDAFRRYAGGFQTSVGAKRSANSVIAGSHASKPDLPRSGALLDDDFTERPYARGAHLGREHGASHVAASAAQSSRLRKIPALPLPLAGSTWERPRAAMMASVAACFALWN